MSTAEWSEIASRLPIGTRVSGTVTQRRTFGVFVRLDELPQATAIVEINRYRPNGEPVPPAGLPEVGSRLVATVVDHSSHNGQVRLRVGDGA